RSGARVLVVPNGVEIGEPVSADERAAARADLGVGADEIAGAWVASLHEHKDPLTPIRAGEDASRRGVLLRLRFTGAGPLRQRVDELAGDAVSVLGCRADVHRVLAAADFFVMSSAREGLSFSLLEAMALGLPAVVSDAPANAE